jgi:hypothetical protein
LPCVVVKRLQNKHKARKDVVTDGEEALALFFCALVTCRRGSMRTTSKTSNYAKPERKRKVYDPAFDPYLKNRPRTAPPRLLARPLAEKAPVAMFVAWLNLSQREKARVFVTANTIAITVRTLSLARTSLQESLAAKTYQPNSTK